MTFTFNLPVKINIPSIPFRSTAVPNRNSIKPLSDGFSSNPIYGNLDSREQIEATAKQNYKIQSLLSEHNLPLKVNLEELENLKQGHLKETRIITAKIYSSLPDELKKDVDIACLQEAALLHDYGKVLIPKDILNKKGKLTYEERKVMELHSELGYELLKNKNINDDIIEIPTALSPLGELSKGIQDLPIRQTFNKAVNVLDSLNKEI